MRPDKLLHRRVGDKLDTELRALLLEQRAHHTLKQRGETLAHIVAGSGESRNIRAVKK